MATETIELRPDWLRVNFGGKAVESSDYHYFWLRHNCPCLNGCRHETTKERLIDASTIPLDIRPLDAQLVTSGSGSAAVQITWPPIPTKDGNGKLVLADNHKHESVYPIDWLYENNYGSDRTNTHSLPPHDASQVTIDYKELLSKYGNKDGALTDVGSTIYKAKLYDLISQFGVAVIRNRGDDTESIIHDFIAPDADVIPTHFGRIEHLRTGNTENKNNDQLGYTNSAVRLHTDQCYSDSVPGFQFLQCIRPADEGGDNYFVHAESAANYLKTEINRRAYDLLTTVPVHFDRKQSNFEALHVSPILRLSDEINPETGEKKLAQVRYSYFTQGAKVTVPFSDLHEWYEALHAWDKLLYRDDFQIKANLSSGDVVIYDNFKVLHARNGFSGPRHMAGVYLDSSDLWAHLGEAKDRSIALNA